MLVTHWADRPRSRSPEALGRFIPQSTRTVRVARADRQGGEALSIHRVLRDAACHFGLSAPDAPETFEKLIS
ncbi:MAG: hypothetical protein KDG55_00595 [Rhodocyclaceae bacterium]|nr:hypothetical protein [Rhodocyclaceae bacterium]